MACGIFLDQGSNPCPLHWQADFRHCTTRGVLRFFDYHKDANRQKGPLVPLGNVLLRTISLSSRIHQEYAFRHRNAQLQMTADEYLKSREEYIDPRKPQWCKGTRGKGTVRRTGPALLGWGNWSRGLIPTRGQLPESEEKHLRLRGEQLICGSLNGVKIRQSLPQPYIP